MSVNKNTKAFFSLVRAGLWEKECRLLPYGKIDFAEVLKLAEEQSVVGLVAAGLGHVTDMKIPKADVLPFIGQTIQVEQRNQAMNHFIGALFEKMRETGLKVLLVKGQGIAQCYEHPLCRSCGDVDLFMDEKSYRSAIPFLSTIAQHVDEESPYKLHKAMTIDSWEVELHGTLRCNLGRKVDNELDTIQADTFDNNKVRIWLNDAVEVPLPAPDNDVIFVFTHILQHFFHGGIGIRQICDWCRFLWMYRDEIDVSLLESRLKVMSLKSEWKAFAAFAVDYLGLPIDSMPLYDSAWHWHRKASRILSFVLVTGNFGHNRDDESYLKRSFLERKIRSLYQHTADALQHFLIFPIDSFMDWWRQIRIGIECVKDEARVF